MCMCWDNDQDFITFASALRFLTLDNSQIPERYNAQGSNGVKIHQRSSNLYNASITAETKFGAMFCACSGEVGPYCTCLCLFAEMVYVI